MNDAMDRFSSEYPEAATATGENLLDVPYVQPGDVSQAGLRRGPLRHTGIIPQMGAGYTAKSGY